MIHLDSHLDTWDPYEGYTGIVSEQSAITHGTFFWHASREGCVSKGTSVHGGLRTKLFVSIGPVNLLIKPDLFIHILVCMRSSGAQLLMTPDRAPKTTRSIAKR